MPIPIGSRFGPYEITGQLGEGGMGEVYRAHDSRLGRDVALKVLHSDVARNADRRARFEREARAVAALNHPNIVALYDIGDADGVVYFVSELVEGESLRDRIDRGPLPIRELLDVSIQIADGIATAHAAGITHRDLKPENIMITRDGRVKILDFGLARQAVTAAPVHDRTVTMNQTQPGTVLGTANYMSPEQVRGGMVDHRSDQFAFGVILFELATGRQAFQRDSAIQTMSAVVTDDPPLTEPSVQGKLPAPLRWAIERCLAKDSDRRYESTRDLREDLRMIREHLTEAFSAASLPALPEAPRVASPGRFWIALAATCAVLAVGLAVMLWRAQRSAGGGFANYRFTPFAVSSEGQGNAMWSKDGKAAAYMGEVNGTYQIFVRYLNSPVPVQLTTTGVTGLYGWSTDSRRIFFRGKNPNPAESARALFSIAAVGGEPEMVLAVDAITADVSPDGKAVAILKQDTDGFRRVYISSPVGSRPQRYPSDKFSTKSQVGPPRLRFSPDGRKILLLMNDGVEKRWMLPYPGGKEEPHEVLGMLPQFGFTPAFSWFPDNRHIVVATPAHMDEPANLWIADTQGPELKRLTSTPSSQYLPAVSPDGKKLLYQEIGSDQDIAKVSLNDGKVIRLIATERDESMPSWAAKAGKFAYVTTRDGPSEIWIHNEDGTDWPLVKPADFAPTPVNLFMDPTLFPEADRVIYTMGEVGGAMVMYISSTSGGAPTRVTSTESRAEFPGGLSPDGRQLVYVDWSDRPALMTVKTSGQATPVRLREDIAASLPQWSPTGEWIVFADREGWKLISPDGKTVRTLGNMNAQSMGFSLDGKKLYGIRRENDHQYLFSLDVNSIVPAPARTIADLGMDYAPASFLSPGYRLSMAPDGTCAIYSIASYKSSIWLFEGFAAPGRASLF